MVKVRYGIWEEDLEERVELCDAHEGRTGRTK